MEVYAKVDDAVIAKVLAPIVTNIVHPILALMFMVAMVVFVYGIVEMFWKGDDAEARKTGRWHMFGGVIGMFIMVSAWGIVNLITNTLAGFR